MDYTYYGTTSLMCEHNWEESRNPKKLVAIGRAWVCSKCKKVKYEALDLREANDER